MPIDPDTPDLTAPNPPLPDTPPVVEAIAAAGVAHAAATGSPHGPFHTHCENCGTKLDGPYCHRCGQHDFEFHRSFWHVFLEALETLFHFEGKFFRNVVTLLFRPGRLSADFNAGRRASQMPPFRLYIFVSFVFFLLIFLGKDDDSILRENDGPSQGVTVAGQPVAAGQFWSTAWAEAAKEMKPEDWQDPAKVARAVEQATVKAEKLQPDAGTVSVGAGPALVAQLREAAAQAKAAAEKQRSKQAGGAAKPKAPDSELERYLEEKGRRAFEPENRARLVESFKHHLPHMLMLCLPFFALFTRVLFRKSGQVYLQHLVVAFHFHTFIYLWVLCRSGWAGIAALPDWGLRGWVVVACNLWMIVYPFLMLRHLFRNSWPKTILKTFLLAAAYTLTLGLGFFVTGLLLFVSL